MSFSKSVLSLLSIVLAIALVGCSENEKSEKITVDQVIASFKTANLEVENTKEMEKQDYGTAPMTAKSGVRFFIPSLGKEAGGRILTFESIDDLEKTKMFYEEAGKNSATFFSWIFVKNNILVQINGELPEDKAKLYKAALNSVAK
ncbi:hypothetical protein JNUCC42_14695 [Brevibacterium sp. JNUCC-42]|nr:hypothetical protein JNUCC42_14695 [Brevibacterium sp. JNUCC-42]